MSEEKVIITHDTKRIIDANKAACALFRQERDFLIDGDLLEGVSNGDMKFLSKLRMYVARMKGEARRERIKFARSDGSTFWAWSETKKIGEELHETTLTYIGEADD